ncbi:MAG: hypothetical protein JW939_09075 [Candidatus Thermoplasmatota archaeon]|nr:hypothetical protein [Candidatus Thermoplasmatota archaeon]
MKGETFRRIWMFIFIGVLCILVATEGISVLTRDFGDLSVENEGEKGLSTAFGSIGGEHKASVILTSPSLLLEEEDPPTTLFISIGPQREYTTTEVHTLMKFYNRGGKLLLADDTGRINILSRRFDITITPGQLYDETFEGHPDLVKIDDVELDFFTGFLVLNRPSSLIFSSGQGAIRSSPASWVDRNGNGVMDNLTSSQGEAPGPRYIAAMTDPDFASLGSGNVVVLSDPSLFMNGMIGRGDNLELFRALVSFLLPDGGRVVFDESVHSTAGLIGLLQRGSSLPLILLTDVNLKIVVGTMVTITLFALAYIQEPPEVQKHVSVLDRTGVAEIVDPGLSASDMTEIRKVFLDRVRLSYGMSSEAFSGLSWNELEEMIDSDELFELVRNGNLKKKMDLNNLIVEVSTWVRQ